MRVLEIASEKNPTFKNILRLAKARGIKKHGLGLLSGKRQVIEVLKEFPERCEGVILSDHKDFPHGIVQQDIPCYHLSRELFGQIDVFFGKARIGLLLNYVFVVYRAYIFDREYLLDYGVQRAEYFPWIYFGFGFLVFFFALFGFLTHRD